MAGLYLEDFAIDLVRRDAGRRTVTESGNHLLLDLLNRRPKESANGS